jgi:hypothetical protein
MTLLVLESTIDFPTVFHMPINGYVMHLKHIGSCVSHDCVDDQSLGRLCDSFPGSHVRVHMTCGLEEACDLIIWGFLGSHATGGTPVFMIWL